MSPRQYSCYFVLYRDLHQVKAQFSVFGQEMPEHQDKRFQLFLGIFQRQVS